VCLVSQVDPNREILSVSTSPTAELARWMEQSTLDYGIQQEELTPAGTSIHSQRSTLRSLVPILEALERVLWSEAT
jgi:hypothetical protein